MPLPAPSIETSPPRRGITGLETWLWCDGDTARTVTVSIRGYRVTARARATEFTWVTGDGGSYTSESCGEAPDPDTETSAYLAAARHTYETKDRYDLELHVTWRGDYRFEGRGRRESGDLGAVTTTSTRRYPVWEVRAVLVD